MGGIRGVYAAFFPRRKAHAAAIWMSLTKLPRLLMR